MHSVGLGAANPGADLVGSRVEFHTHFVLSKFSGDRLRAIHLVVAKRQHSHLFRREPEREVACVVLDQKGDEPLVCAQRGAVNAERSLCGVFARLVLEAEALGHGKVHLVRGDGELPAGDAVHLHIDLWPVKRGLVLYFHKINARLDENFANHVLSLQPQLRFVDVFVAEPFGAVRAEAHAEFLKPENLEIFQVHFVDGSEFVGELLRRAVDVRVVHLHRPHAHEAHQFAGTLVAITGAILGQT